MTEAKGPSVGPSAPAKAVACPTCARPRAVTLSDDEETHCWRDYKNRIIAEDVADCWKRSYDRVRVVGEEVFRAAMVMFENLPAGAYEDAPYSSLALAVHELRTMLDGPIREASAASARNAPPESSAALSTEGKEKP